jgi:hypothetical protein
VCDTQPQESNPCDNHCQPNVKVGAVNLLLCSSGRLNVERPQKIAVIGSPRGPMEEFIEHGRGFAPHTLCGVATVSCDARHKSQLIGVCWRSLPQNVKASSLPRLAMNQIYWAVSCKNPSCHSKPVIAHYGDYDETILLHPVKAPSHFDYVCPVCGVKSRHQLVFTKWPFRSLFFSRHVKGYVENQTADSSTQI